MKQKKILLLATILTILLVLPTLAQTFTYGDRIIKTVNLDGKSVDLNRATDNVTKKFGIVDRKTGNVLIPFVWDYLMFSLEDEIFECKDNTKKESEYFNFQCKSLYKGKTYQFPKTHLGDEIGKNYAIYCIEENGLIGLINTKGKIVVPCEYKKIKLTNYENDSWELTKTDGATGDFYGKTQELVFIDQNAKYEAPAFYKPVNVTLEQLSEGYWFSIAKYKNDKAPLEYIDTEYGIVNRINFGGENASDAKKLLKKILRNTKTVMTIKRIFGPKHSFNKITNVIFNDEVISLEGRILVTSPGKKYPNKHYEIVEFIPNEKLVLKQIGNADGKGCAICETTVYAFKSTL